jgi:hypothetical protein
MSNKIKSRLLVLSLATLCLSVLTSCGARDYSYTDTISTPAPVNDVGYDNTTSAIPSSDSSRVVTQPSESMRKKMIQTGEIEMETRDDKAFTQYLRKVVSESGGIFVQDNMDLTDRGSVHNFRVRMRPQHFDSLVVKVTEGPGDLHSQHISAEDATMDYVDMQSMMNAREEAIRKLTEETDKAKGTEVTLLTEETARLKADLIKLRSDLAMLETKTAWSTLSIVVRDNGGDTHFAGEFGHAMHTGWHGLARCIILLAYGWPVILLMLLGSFLIWRLNRKPRKAAAAA